MSAVSLPGLHAELPEQHDELLIENPHVRMVRCHLADGTSLIRKEALGADALVRLRHEQRILERLAGVPGVPQLKALAGDAAMLVGDLSGRRLLDSLASDRPWAVERLLPLARGLATILAQVHRRGVQHRSIEPGNILLRGPDAAPAIICFEHATTSAQDRPDFIHHSRIMGNLRYAAPEQTGRSGHAVDQRSDLYALGATLYEAATGRPPFVDDDPLRLIHQHLAVLPVPPLERVPALPRAMSDIILRLLEKSPERRYQSAEGLLHDLLRLSDALDAGHRASFDLGERDFPQRLTPSGQLVGRDAERVLLQQAFDAALAQPRCVLVSGAPGVGKSALVNTLRPWVTARRGWFVSGKFDQLRQDGDTDGVRQALRGLGRLLLAEPEDRLAALRNQLRQALGVKAGLIAAMLPEFAMLLDVPAATPGHDGENAEQQLVQAVLDVLRTVVSPQQPLVMVIDDLQWASAPTARRFDAIVNHVHLHGLLLVGAYRDNEVHAAHPLAAQLKRWARLGNPPLRLPLQNLPEAGIAELLGEMLRLPPNDAAELSAAIAPCTGGNPFDTVELVNALRHDGMLVLGEGGWKWNPDAIRRHHGQHEVVGLLQARMARLPERTQALLSTMACLGGEVPVDLLQVAQGEPLASVEGRMTPALDDGLIVMVEDSVRAVRFGHDRVQQAAYARLAADEGSALHLTIARRLAAASGFQAVAAEQYLPALGRLSDPAERRAVACLLGTAAGRLRLVNEATALRWLTAALDLLADSTAPDDAARRIALQVQRYAALFGLGRLEEADAAYPEIERSCPDPLDRLDAACVQIALLTQRARQREALELGVALLGELDHPLPEALGQVISQGLDELVASEWQDTLSRPEVTDRRIVAIAKVLDRLLVPAVQCQSPLAAWVAVETHRLWTRHGPCPALLRSASLSIPFALIGGRRAYRRAHTVSRHALAVSEARGYTVAEATARHMISIATHHWYGPVDDNVANAREAHERLLRGGEAVLAALSFDATLPALVECAPSLAMSADEADAGLAFSARVGSDYAVGLYRLYQGLVRSLREEVDPAVCFNEAVFAEDERQGGKLAGGVMGLTYHALRALEAALQGDARQSARHAGAAMPLVDAAPGFYITAWVQFLNALALSDLYRSEPEGQAARLAEFDRSRDWLAERAADCPANFMHLLRWVDAERAWMTGDGMGAARAFDAALAAIAGRPRPWQRALLTERMAMFYRVQGVELGARELFGEARRLYALWGASTKVNRLDDAHPYLAGRRARADVQDGVDGVGKAMGEASIDLLGVLRASQVLSSETNLERLTARVVELMGTLTGATAVLLLLPTSQPPGWKLLPGEPGGPARTVEEAGALGLLPLSAFRYAERTGTLLLLDDATRDDRFASDPYFAGADRCSLLVMPILSQGKAKAILVLENRLSDGAFSARRLDAVKLIAGQLSVSLENASLYAELEARVELRTQQLREAQAQLVAAARHAGRAEIATNVLHNVGNVLNSVNVSAELMGDTLRASKSQGLARAVRLIEDHAADLGRFFTADDRGQRLPGYLAKLSQSLAAERARMLEELASLGKRIGHIKEIVATQQAYAGKSSLVESVDLRELVEDAVQMDAASMMRHRVQVATDIPELPMLQLDRGRMLQILLNLLSNAKQACSDKGGAGRVTLKAACSRGRLRITVSDDGVGIAPENLTRIFAHGFTTRPDGHGFGLHSCVLAAQEMGGSLVAASDGVGLGAAFMLEVPQRPS